MEIADRWSTPRLADFVAAITGAADEASAIRCALDWTTDALEAEIGMIVEDGRTLASVGFPRGDVPLELSDAMADGTEVLTVQGIGLCRLASTRKDSQPGVDMVVARVGTDQYSRDEIRLLCAAARSLSLTLRLFRALSAERVMRDDLQRRQKLLECLASIQRSITRRASLTDVLNAITLAARDLLDVDVTWVGVVDPESPREMVMASQHGLPPDMAAGMARTAVGAGAAGRAVAEDRLVIIENHSSALDAHACLGGAGLQRAMAAPMHTDASAVGAIVLATRRADLSFGPLEQEALITLAAHASLAITDAKLAEHIQQLAFHDELTSLPNRRLFIERLNQALIRARRRREHVAVLFLDLDRFKTINDSLGHAAGDLLLITVGERLRKCLRDEDTAARLGGDEFAILALCDRDGATKIAARVLAAMEPPFVLETREVLATASIGIALDSGGRSNAGGMLRDADTAMYRAKSVSGGGYVVFAPSMHATALARMDLEADLRGAATRDELQLDYQPIVELGNGRIVGVEALIRWHHPERGVISPREFIPLAEETGQITGLGRWILDEACTEVHRWQGRDTSRNRLTAAINISPRQLRDSCFVQDVARSLERSGLSPGDLVLEITEGAVMLDLGTAIRRLQSLRELGISLAIDDFGTGHSSLALLRRLPINILKIDKMFVDTIATDATAAAFLESIVRMADILSLQVVAEGIETAEQASLIASFGNVLGQGYHLGRPIGGAAIERLLAAEPVRGRRRLVSLSSAHSVQPSTPYSG